MMRAHQGWCSAWSAGSRGRAWLAMAVLWAAMGSGPARGSTLFGLIDTGEIYASSDVGRTWSIRSTLRVRDAVAITALSSPQDLLLATRSGSIFRSSDAGVDWNQVGAVLASDVSAMAIDSHGPVLLLTASGTVHRSTNQGGSFVIIGSRPTLDQDPQNMRNVTAARLSDITVEHVLGLLREARHGANA